MVQVRDHIGNRDARNADGRGRVRWERCKLCRNDGPDAIQPFSRLFGASVRRGEARRMSTNQSPSTRSLSSHLLAAAVALAALGGCGGGTTGPSISGGETPATADGGGSGEVGSKAPELSAVSVGGTGPKTLAEAAGKVVIIDFWATYCDPCKKSFPKYQELVDKFGGDLVVIGVSVDDPEDVKEDKLKEFAETTGAKFSIVWDKTQATAGKYSPPKMPTSFVIDKEGVVRHVHAGYESGEEDKIAEEVAALLGK